MIIDEAEALLYDSSNIKWKEAEHLQALNNGIKEICNLKPNTYVVTESATLAEGIEQTLPDGSFRLIEITRNMGVSPGKTSGKIIRRINRKVLDSINPDWGSATASAIVDYYMYNEYMPLKFEVSPPQPSTGFGFVQISCAKAPLEIAKDAVIPIPDIYRGVLLDYLLYRAYSRDNDPDSNAQRAINHYSLFQMALGLKPAEAE